MLLDEYTWARHQWATADLGDVRLTRQAVRLGAQIAANPSASLPEQTERPAALKATYRLLNNRKATLEALLQPHWEHTRTAAGQVFVVLLPEDTTELDFTAHRRKTGLGPIGNGKGRGLLLHSTLAVLPQTRSVLGLAHTQVVLRRPRRRTRAKWARSPEGRLWETSTAAIGHPPPGVCWVHISDAGSDCFPYLAACRTEHTDFVVRACRNRKLEWAASAPQARRKKAHALLDYLRSLPPQPDSAYAIVVPADKNHPAREAQVVVQWARVTIRPPAQAPAAIRRLAPLVVDAVRVWEPQPPRRTKRVEWVLLSSLPVTTLAEAHQVVDYYTCRPVCEDYHQCLKTGCRVEHTQLDDGADVARLLGFVAPVAVRLLQLRQAARETPVGPADVQIDPLMVRVLLQRQGSTQTTLTLSEFWQGVARLGGYQGRRSDGPPGWRTIWRGWHKLSELTEGARLFQALDSS
jgi:hypothetical protein